MTLSDCLKVAALAAILIAMLAFFGDGAARPCFPGRVEALFTSCPRADNPVRASRF